MAVVPVVCRSAATGENCIASVQELPACNVAPVQLSLTKEKLCVENVAAGKLVGLVDIADITIRTVELFDTVMTCGKDVVPNCW